MNGKENRRDERGQVGKGTLEERRGEERRQGKRGEERRGGEGTGG